MKIYKKPYGTFLVCFFIMAIKGYAQPLPYNQHIVDSLSQKLPLMNEDTTKVKNLIWLSQMYISKGNGVMVLKYANEADSISKKINYTIGRIEALGQMAFYHATTGDWPQSIMEINEAIPLTKDENTHWSIYLLNLKFINYGAKNDFKVARMWALRALNHPTFQTTGEIDRWPTYMQLGLSYEWENRLDSAQYYADILKEYLKKYHHADLEGNTFALLGNIARKKKNYEEALYYYRLGEQNTIGMAWVYDEQNKADSAIYYALKTLDFAQSRHDLRLILESSQILARHYAKIDPLQSNKYLQLYTATKDTLFNADKMKQLEEIRLNEQKLRFENIGHEKAFKSKMIQYALLGLAVLFFISALFFYRNNQVKKTANKQLEETNAALKTTQAQLELKNRDLEIEAALDKVRARSLAMRDSNEIQDVAYVLYNELKKLNFQFGACSVYLIDEQDNLEAWVAGFEAHEYPQRIFVPKFNHPLYNQQIQSYREGKKYDELHLTPDIKQAYDDHMFIVADYKKLKPELQNMMRSMPSAIFSLAYNKYGALHWGPSQLTEAESIIFQKFSTVFEQAYTRFLDLKKAENQAREAQIETAIEKIRSQSLAMHHSGELKEVITIMSEKLRELNVLIDSVSIQLFDEKTKNSFFWVGSDLNDKPRMIYLPYDETIFNEDTYLKDSWQAKTTGESIINKKYSFEQKNKYFEYVFANNDLTIVPQPVRDFIMRAQSHITCLFIEKNSSLFADSWNGQVYSEDKIEVLRRVAKVFEQAYIRFLDLQKAEAQAREAQIEVSLERIRAKTSSMQSSNELSTIIGMIYLEMGKLNVHLQHSFFMIFNPENLGVTWWMASGESLDLGQGYFVKHSEHPPQLAYFKGWEERQETWRYLMQGAEKANWDAFLFHETELSSLPPFIIDNMKSFKSVHLEASFNNFGCLTTGNEEPIGDEAFELLIRFSKVFDQTYTRFLDLKKAEAQAREAQIEAALEKIRSRSLAMHRSDELKDVIAVMFEKMKELDVVTGTIALQFFDEETKNTDFWVSNDLQHVAQVKLPYDEPFFKEDTYMKDCWEAKAKGENIINRLYTFEQKNAWFDYTFAYNDFETIPPPVREFIKQAPNLISNLFIEKNSALYADNWFGQYYSNDKIDVLERVAKVFDQAYVRFLDLQRAEAQAREAQIEVALERVRARAMAMQKSDELADAARILYHEFGKLGIKTLSCGYMFIDENKQNQTAWVTLPDGTILPNFIDFPLTGDHVLDKRYESWKAKKPLHAHSIKGKENKEHHQFLSQHVPVSVTNDIFAHIPDSITFYSANFSSGYLLILAPNFFSPDEEQIIIRFAKVFELTYTRFLDLKQAEAQAQEAKIEASFERIRASALAMQTSDEFLGVVRTLYEQINVLGQKELEATIIQFYDIEQGFINSWNAQNLDETISGNITLGTSHYPFDACRLTLEWLNAYKSNQEDYTIVAEGEILKEWLHFLMKMSPEIKSRLGDTLPDISNFHFSKFSEGALSMVSTKPFEEDSKYLLKRAASAFDLAYKRYIDLQLKEEQALKLSQEKQRLEAALKELQATQDQLIQKEKLASLGELTAGIAHEIQNPLNFVNNFSELSVDLVKDLKEEIEKSPLTPKGGIIIEDKAYFDELFYDLSQNQEKINHHGKRASSIVKGMLEHSRASTGVKELTDINKLADEYLRLSYHGLRAKDKSFNADFKIDFDGNLPKINVIPQDIGRVLLNLINNAFYAVHQKNLQGLEIDYTPSVIVSTQNIDNQIIIKIEDNGIGMSEATKAKIFQPFFTTKPTGQGTGLGLSLAYDIVTKGHGGSLEVVSTEGGGSEFIIKLPIV